MLKPGTSGGVLAAGSGARGSGIPPEGGGGTACSNSGGKRKVYSHLVLRPLAAEQSNTVLAGAANNGCAHLGLRRRVHTPLAPQFELRVVVEHVVGVDPAATAAAAINGSRRWE